MHTNSEDVSGIYRRLPTRGGYFINSSPDRTLTFSPCLEAAACGGLPLVATRTVGPRRHHRQLPKRGFWLIHSIRAAIASALKQLWCQADQAIWARCASNGLSPCQRRHFPGCPLPHYLSGSAITDRHQDRAAAVTRLLRKAGSPPPRRCSRASSNTLAVVMSKALREFMKTVRAPPPPVRFFGSRPPAAGWIGPEADPGLWHPTAPMCGSYQPENRGPTLSQLFGGQSPGATTSDTSGANGVAAAFREGIPRPEGPRAGNSSRYNSRSSYDAAQQAPPLVEIPSCGTDSHVIAILSFGQLSRLCGFRPGLRRKALRLRARNSGGWISPGAAGLASPGGAGGDEDMLAGQHSGAVFSYSPLVKASPTP